MFVEVSNPLPLPPSAPSPPGAATASREASVCANCGQELHGPFCSDCGQHVNDLHRSVWRFVADFAENIFCWDNKLFRTLQPLLTRPGALTLDYLAGRRVRYVQPLRLFLFTSAICLTIIQSFGGSPARVNIGTPAGNKKHHQPSLDFRFGDPSPSPAPAGTVAPAPPPETRGDEDEDEDSEKSTKDLTGEINQAVDQARQAAVQGHAVPAGAVTPPDESFGDRVAHRAEEWIKADGGAERMRKEITTDVQRRVSYVALALLPIFAAMLRGLYWRRDSYYFAHLIFSLHYHTFLLLFVATYTLLALVLPTSLWPVHTLLRASLLLPGAYLFLALRRLYGEGIRRSLCKVLVLGGMHLAVLFVGLAVVGGLAIYRALS